MNFQEAERTYEDLRAQYTAGKLSNSDFENEVSKLKVQDADGRWWQIGVQSGDWYVHDGTKWSKATPPVRPSSPPPTTAPPAEPLPVIPVAGAAAGGVPPGPSAAPASKPAGPSRLTPRFFSAAPATRGGGLPTPVLIGIVAVAALLIIAILVAVGMLVTGQFFGGGATPTAVARATNTPLGGLALLPSPTFPVLPTIPPPPVATNTPVQVLGPTAVITATTVVTQTRAATGPAATPGAAGSTATKRPATSAPVVPPATKAPSLPPGYYAMKMRTDPAQPAPGQQITFYVTFLNNTGSAGPNSWIVKIFKCAAACTGSELADNRSIGETPRANTTVLPGTTELSAGPWTVGLGACNLVASPYYVDALGNVVPFPTQSGDRMYYNFKICQ